MAGDTGGHMVAQVVAQGAGIWRGTAGGTWQPRIWQARLAAMQQECAALSVENGTLRTQLDDGQARETQARWHGGRAGQGMGAGPACHAHMVQAGEMKSTSDTLQSIRDCAG